MLRSPAKARSRSRRKPVFLDGVQVATGATLGKRTVEWVQADRLAVRIKNTRTGKTAVLRPTLRIDGTARIVQVAAQGWGGAS